MADPSELSKAVRGADLVVGALPGWLGFRALSTVIAERKSFVDISFMPEDGGELSAQAAAAGVVGIVDCGVAPGMSNLLSARAVAAIEQPEEVTILVGGLPLVRRWPFEYAAVFSPIDVIEEYTRPARYIEHGKLVVRPALSDVELIEFPEVGTLEAFNTDGLRSLMTSLPVPRMKEKTMRYPGHAQLMRAFRDTGLFSQDPVMVGAAEIKPVDLTCELLKKGVAAPARGGRRDRDARGSGRKVRRAAGASHLGPAGSV